MNIDQRIKQLLKERLAEEKEEKEKKELTNYQKQMIARAKDNLEFERHRIERDKRLFPKKKKAKTRCEYL
ncbi:MAG: hypothetical protein ACKKMW_02085 [Candidatus Nealsonbacteria bacterium]